LSTSFGTLETAGSPFEAKIVPRQVDSAQRQSALAHNSSRQGLFAEEKINRPGTSTYSSDLSPYYVYLFYTTKNHLKGSYFETGREVESYDGRYKQLARE
jgi:hypothetical protein